MSDSTELVEVSSILTARDFCGLGPESAAVPAYRFDRVLHPIKPARLL
ncbi:MAG: hypothetical protein JO251_22025 [Verrucomicrobia bacterium]|nr:hypothetical protein [Verrucomicrobiota bacterium]